MAIDKSLLSGSNALLVLALLEEEDMYGYQMTATLKARSENVFDFKAGTLYPLLHQLEQSGSVEAYEAPSGGRMRRYYRLTGAGRAQLAERRAEWRVYAGAMENVLGGAGDARI